MCGLEILGVGHISRHERSDAKPTDLPACTMWREERVWALSIWPENFWRLPRPQSSCDQLIDFGARPLAATSSMADLPLSSSSTMATLAKLTSQSTQTLSLLLERQRLQTLSGDGSSLHLPQITRNLQQLRTGILDLEDKEGNIEAVRLLKSQYERMRGMLGPDAEVAGVERCVRRVVAGGRLDRLTFLAGWT